MSFVGKAIGGLVGGITGSTQAANATTEGAQIAAQAQQNALDYLKQTEAIPQQYREGALNVLGGLYGLGGQDASTALDTLKSSPIYSAITSQIPTAEEAILRNASATGGLRSGNTSDALARLNSEVQNQALQQSIQGLGGLAQLPSNANNIAQLTAGIGNTQAQGITGAAQAIQAGRGQALSGLLALGGAAFSDARLKDKVQKIGTRNGHNWYSWVWNKEAETLGMFGTDEGYMAHEIMQDKPEMIEIRNGYLMVKYDQLEAA